MAQTTASAALCCLKTEVELSRLAGDTYQGIVNKDQSYGVAAAVELNSRKGLNQFINVAKARPGDPTCTETRLTVKYPIPQCGEGTDVNVSFACDAPDAAAAEQLYGYDDFTFDNAVGAEFSMDATAFDCSCEALDMQYAMALYNEGRKMYQRYNKKLTELVLASVGSNYDSTQDTATTPLSLKLLYTNPMTGTIAPQPLALSDIGYQYDRMGMRDSSPVVISGSRKLASYIQTRAIFAGNEWGFNSAAAGVPGNVYQDYQLGTTAALVGSPATDPIITLYPGTFDLVEWFKFDNPNQRIVDGRISWAPIQASQGIARQKVDIGRAIGIDREFAVDMEITYDEKCNKINVRMRKDFGFWCMPQAAFCAGDTYNGKLLWNVDCAPYTCDDAC